MPGVFHDLCDLALLANQPAIRGLGRGAQQGEPPFDSDGLTTALVIFCAFFLFVWGMARLLVRSEGPFAKNSARGLFGELCLAHRLTRSDRWLLARLAGQHRLADPSCLFLDSRWLDPDTLGPDWRKHAGRLRDLRLALFAGLSAPLSTRDAGELGQGVNRESAG